MKRRLKKVSIYCFSFFLALILSNVVLKSYHLLFISYVEEQIINIDWEMNDDHQGIDSLSLRFGKDLNASYGKASLRWWIDPSTNEMYIMDSACPDLLSDGIYNLKVVLQGDDKYLKLYRGNEYLYVFKEKKHPPIAWSSGDATSFRIHNHFYNPYALRDFMEAILF